MMKLTTILLCLFTITTQNYALANQRFSCEYANDSKSSEQLQLLVKVGRESVPELLQKIQTEIQNLGMKYSQVSLTSFAGCSNENSLELDFESARQSVLNKLTNK